MNCSKSRAGAVVADEASRGRDEAIIPVAEAELIKAGAKMAAAARRKNDARASLVVIATTPVHAERRWCSKLCHRRKGRCKWGCAVVDAVEVTAAEVLSPMMVLSCCPRAAFEVAAAAEAAFWPMLPWMVLLWLSTNKHNCRDRLLAGKAQPESEDGVLQHPQALGGTWPLRFKKWKQRC